MNDKELIAPCGINCGICKYYYREKNQCPGCRGPNENKSKSCIECIIVNCEEIKKSKSKLCYECSKIVNLPINKVQTTYNNRSMETLKPEDLLHLFEQGKKIDIKPLRGIKNRSAHMEYTLSFITRK